MNTWKSSAAFVLGMTWFILAGSSWLVSGDRRVDTNRSILKIHVGTAGLFSAAGHDHWVTAPFAEGSFDDSDPPYVAFTVDARKLTLVADKKLSTEQQAEVQHTMQASVLQGKLYPFISFRSTKIEKTGVDHWLVTGELTLRGETRPIQAEVHYAAGAYTGRSAIKQTDFGIDPISGAGGIVKVKNELEIQFVVVPIQ
jgi:hypothetical protein